MMNKEQLIEKMKEVRNTYFNNINEYVKINMPGWKVTSFGYNSFRLGFENGEVWSNGTPKTTDLDMYVGYEQDYDFKTRDFGPKYFKFQMNPFTAGSLNIIDDETTGHKDDSAKLQKYYKGVGYILSDQRFANGLRSILIEFTDTYETFKTSLDEIIAEENRIEAENRKIQEEKENREKYEDDKRLFEDDEYNFVIICPDHYNKSKFIYRKKNVKVLGFYEDSHSALAALHNLGDYKIIEKTKLKVLPYDTAA